MRQELRYTWLIMRSIARRILSFYRKEFHSALHTARHWWHYVKRHPKTILMWGMGGFFAFFGLVLIWAATLQLPDLASISNTTMEQSVKIYDRTGEVLLYDLHDKKQRTVVPLDQISPNIQDAIISIEDAEFYSHKGVRPLATLRAILTNISQGNPLSGGGGSTITQQVIKGSVLTTDKTISRKLKEWILAYKLERVLTKDQILSLYLNQVPLGGALYGVEEGAQVFFSKHASELTIPEAAYIAAVLPAPTYYSPYGNHKAALDARKNLVLQKMYEHGYITEAQLTDAKATEVTFTPQRDTSIQAPHFVFYVRQYLEEKYGADALQQGGWKVTTTLDADLQAKAEEVVQARAKSQEENFNSTNTGVIALDPRNGQILVMVGSRNYFDTEIDGNFNVTLASRQPGSSFKPFAYAQAFLEGYTPDTVLFDVRTQFSTTCAPTNLTTGDGCYSPVNYDNQFRGPMTLRDALAQSINVPSVKVLYLAGVADTLRLAKSMGISTLGDPGQYGLTLVLGGGEVSLLDITSAYGTFAQDGTHYSPISVLKIQDPNGTIVEDNSEPSGSQVLPPDVAQKINDVLSDPVARGPLGDGGLFTFAGRDVAVKTGTTNDYRDAWNIGYTPNLVLGMWAGNNDNTSMVKKVSGLIVGPSWREIMQYALSKTPNESFTRTEYDYTGLKPQLRGVWQVPGSDGSIHEILYWVNKTDPNGPPPSNPANDSQFERWDLPVRNWAAANSSNYPAQNTTPTINQTSPQTLTPYIPGGVPPVNQ